MIRMSTRWNSGVITPLGWPRKALNELEEMAGEKETGLLCLDCWMDGWMDGYRDALCAVLQKFNIA